MAVGVGALVGFALRTGNGGKVWDLKSEIFRFGQHDSAIRGERCSIGSVDEIRHFYQCTVAAQTSYPLS